MDTTQFRRQLDAFRPQKPHDAIATLAMQEALAALENGGWGIGAVLIDDQTGQVLAHGQNRTHRSDHHAEMDLLNQFEDAHPDKTTRKQLLAHCTVVTSLEPCPMCLCRLIAARVGTVYYVAPDTPGGMVHLFDQLPDSWRTMAQGHTYAPADCSAELIELAGALFQLSLSPARREVYPKSPLP